MSGTTTEETVSGSGGVGQNGEIRLGGRMHRMLGNLDLRPVARLVARDLSDQGSANVLQRWCSVFCSTCTLYL